MTPQLFQVLLTFASVKVFNRRGCESGQSQGGRGLQANVLEGGSMV